MTPPDAVVLSYLALAGYFDIRTREISRVLTVLAAGVGVLNLLCFRADPFPDFWFSLLPGAALLGAALTSSGRIGIGDGLTLLVCGFFADAAYLAGALFVGLLFSSCYALFLLAVRKKGKNVSYPFLPFLFFGYLAGFLYR